MMKKILLLILYLTFTCVQAQQRQIDSLQNLLSKTQNDSLKLTYYQKMCELCDAKDRLKYGTLALKFVEVLESKTSGISKINLLKYKGGFKSTVSIFYREQYDFKKAIEIRQELITLYSNIKDTALLEQNYSIIINILSEQRKMSQAFEIANGRLNHYEKSNSLYYIAYYQRELGEIYDRISNYDKMVEYYQKNLTTNTKMNDRKGIALAHAELAQAYYYNGKSENALKHNLKSLQYFQKENDAEAFITLLQRSAIYTQLNDFNKAMELSDQCLKIAMESKDSSLVGKVLFRRAGTYGKMKDYINAIECEKRYFNINLAVNNDFNMMSSGMVISRYYVKLNQLENAFKYIRISDSLAKKTGDIYAERGLYELKSNLYNRKRNFEMALKNLLKYNQLNDSIRELEDHADVEKRDMILEFEKNQLKLKDEQLLKDQQAEAEKAKQKIITVSISIGLVIVLILLLMIFRNYTLKQKSNLELSQRNEEISKQKHIVEEKQKEITESITYAKRLQEAILPPLEFINAHLKNSFVYYKPKDIVAGDFYWAEKVGERFFIAAADSTGHGVPGAMVSVVCSNALNRSIKEFQLADTGKILDKTR
ncbi:MAG: tetratricopeptide repeat protein, partial [Bacteroidia bacterium]|nr:tetratricopeptide repeat protein [Bacteroidia bacterium]